MKLLTYTLGLALLAGGAHAEGGQEPGNPKREKKKGHRKNPMVRLVTAADADKNGDITAQEWSAFVASLNPDENGVVARESLMKATGHKKRPEGERGERPEGKRPRKGPGLDTNENGKIDVEDLNKLFLKLDKNGDKTIQATELRSAAMGPMAAHILMRAADADKNGELTAAEVATFVQAITVDGVISAEKLGEAMPQRRRRRGGPEGADRPERPERPDRPEGAPKHDKGSRIARVFDYDGDGKLTGDDFDAIFASFDKNGDRVLTVEELPQRPQRGPRGQDGERRRRPQPGDDG